MAVTHIVGASVKRREDPRLLTGTSAYLDDIKQVGVLHAAILRSPYAHARIRRIDIRSAQSRSDVIAVLTCGNRALLVDATA